MIKIEIIIICIINFFYPLIITKVATTTAELSGLANLVVSKRKRREIINEVEDAEMHNFGIKRVILTGQSGTVNTSTLDTEMTTFLENLDTNATYKSSTIQWIG